MAAVERGSRGRKVLSLSVLLTTWPHCSDGVLLAAANLGASSCCSQLGMLPAIEVRLPRTFVDLWSDFSSSWLFLTEMHCNET